jgi:hypothetical protein
MQSAVGPPSTNLTTKTKTETKHKQNNPKTNKMNQEKILVRFSAIDPVNNTKTTYTLGVVDANSLITVGKWLASKLKEIGIQVIEEESTVPLEKSTEEVYDFTEGGEVPVGNQEPVKSTEELAAGLGEFMTFENGGGEIIGNDLPTTCEEVLEQVKESISEPSEETLTEKPEVKPAKGGKKA